MKSISDETGAIGVDAWLTKAFQKGHLIEPERLKGTKANLVSADAVQKWHQLLNNWYLEPSHRGNLRFAAAAQELAKQFPAPEDASDRLGPLRERASIAKEQIERFESQVEDWYRSTERSMGGRDLERVISVAAKAFNQRHDMNKNQEKWTAEEEKLVENFLDVVRREVHKYFDEWAKELRPKSTDEIVDFQDKLKRAAKTLERLGLPEQKKVLEQRSDTALARFRLVAENQYVLSSAQSFLKSHVGNFSTPSQTLKQWLKDGQGLAGQLDDIKRLDTSAVQLARELGERLETLQRIVDEQRGRLDALAKKTISSFDELRETLEEVEQARAATEGTADQAFVDELRRQLKQAHEDWTPLRKFEGTIEELASLVEARVEAREREVQESGAEPYWSFEDLYSALVTELRQLLAERAERWFESVIPDDGAIAGWPLQRCRDANHQLDDHPAYVERELQSRIEEASGRVKARIAQIEKEERETRARAWVEQNVPAREQLTSFGVDDCRLRLSRVSDVPDFLSPIDMACVAEVRSLLQERLDELDFSQLVDRAKRLPLYRRRELLTALQNALQEL
jgi:predicted DNA-binding protein